jgi:UDPglucose--hexose-1-phosphate uridylyltransferase
MSEIRQDLSTKDWTIFATERSGRPSDFEKIKENRPVSEYESKCPFCKGNENMTLNEILSIKSGRNWSVRVVPNKYPALRPKRDYSCSVGRHTKGPYLSIDGVGNHEVIIESPKHNDDLYKMKPTQLENVIKAYRKRFITLSRRRDCKLIVIFRNRGGRAGTSLRHPHSQLAALPFVPGFVKNKLYESERYFDDSGRCAYCDISEYETKAEERVICKNKAFIAFSPYASMSPYSVHIFPKEHQACFSEISESNTKYLASILGAVLKKLYYVLDDPDYNYIIDSAPVDQKGNKHYHWHIEIFPRLSTRAGFEIGSGININTVLPEKCAKSLRDCDV